MHEIIKQFEINPFSSVFKAFWISLTIVFLLTTFRLLGIQDMIVRASENNKTEILSRFLPQLQEKHQNSSYEGGE